LTLTNTDFIRNTAGASGGAAGSEIIWVQGGLFEGTRCTQDGCSGGGFSAYGLLISGTQFISNSARARGGAVAAAYLSVVNSMFERNACSTDGCVGGALAGGVSLNVRDTQLVSNTARLGGGGAWSHETASLTGALLQGNTCTQVGCTGGGLLALFDGVTLSRTDFIQNSSRGNGGGAYVEGATNVAGGHFTGNTCTDSGCYGGGLRANAGLVVSATAFLGNRALGHGGGLSHQSGAGRVVNALFARNSAVSGGAALYLASDGAVDILHTTIASPTLGAGAAIDVITGTVQIIDTVFANYSVGIRRIGNGSVYEDYNLFSGVPSTKVGPMTGGANDLAGDPRFANPPSDDYHLRLGSAAMDSGADVLVTTDFDGDTRPQRGGFDRGYDEYVDHPLIVYLPLVRR
jgi:predicted outer membrane repeat protein